MRKAMAKFLKRSLNALMDDIFYKDSRNIERWRQRKALEETGIFVEQNMPLVQSFGGRYALMRFAVETAKATSETGLVCEFGVAAGKSINFIARLLPTMTVYGFDSFEGLPEDWRDGLPKGHFKVGRLPRVASNVVLIPGWFEETLPDFLEKHPQKALFLHIDCDLYSSTKTVFDAMEQRIGAGTVILFDEFFNYPGWKEGEYKAFTEFVARSQIPFNYIGYNRYGTQVAIQVV
ncbi:MAG: class I SAM-dependent methyltransferase [Anaerolineae bacterium]|nr:MAG: class I SAM-dependent methyltransferase [Anaerolineae bacterium]